MLVFGPASAALKTMPQTTAIAGYSGPGDVVGSATAWWGLRGYNSAYSNGHNPAIDVCDTATGLTCTTGIVILTNGNLDVPTASAAAACATSCSVTKLYDQTGNGNHLTQATIAKAPVLTFNCVNTSLPCLTFLIANVQILSIASFSTQANPYTINALFERTASPTTFATYAASGAANGGQILSANLANKVTGCGGTGGCLPSTLAATDSVFHTMHVAFGASTFSGYVDTTGTTGTQTSVGPALTGATFNLGCTAAGASCLTGHELEIGVWPGAQNTTQIGNLMTNERAYWNF